MQQQKKQEKRRRTSVLAVPDTNHRENKEIRHKQTASASNTEKKPAVDSKLFSAAKFPLFCGLADTGVEDSPSFSTLFSAPRLHVIFFPPLVRHSFRCLCSVP